MDRISVVVPIYKVEKYLRQCLDSIVNQTYRDLEIILVDDGSPDKCGAICDEYAAKDERIKVIHKQNGGVSAARNDGIEKASGKWITFVDPDDWCEPDYYETLLNSFCGDEPDVICAGGAFYEYADRCSIRKYVSCSFDITRNDRIEWALFPARVMSRLVDTPFFFRGYPGSFCWDKVYNADMLKKAEFRFRVALHPYEDELFNFAVFDKAVRVTGCTYIGYHYRRTNTLSVTKSFQEDFLRNVMAYLDGLNDYEDKITVNEDFLIHHVIVQAALNCFWSSLSVYFFHNANREDNMECTGKLEEWKQNGYVQRAIWNRSNQYLTKNRIILKYILRLPGIRPVKAYYKLVQMMKYLLKRR